MLLSMRLIWLALVVIMGVGCRSTDPGRADAISADIDNTKAQQSTLIDGVGRIAPGARLTYERASAFQPSPPKDPATASVHRKDGRSEVIGDTGGASELSATLSSLNILVWLGALTVIVGVVISALWFKLRGSVGWIGGVPWWLGPAVSLCGIGFIFLPRFVEVATGPLVIIGLSVLVLLILLAILAAWRNRKAIERRLGIDLPLTAPGIGK